VACDVARQSDKIQSYQATGEVVEVVPDQGQVVIDHENIPGLMPGMIMNFDVPNPAVLAKLRPGQKISFTLEMRDRSFRVVDASVLEEGDGAGAAGTSGTFALANTPDEVAPDFALTDQEGRALALADLRGRYVLLDFIYTHCPGPCPILTGIHVSLQSALPESISERVQFVSITLDPARDTPAVMKAYGEARGVDFANWSFLTGDPDTIDRVLRSYGVGAGVQPNGEIEHLVMTILIDDQGRIVHRYMGLEHTAAAIRSDLEEALAQG